MAANAPVFGSTPRDVYVQIATANTARDGTGTVGTLITAAAAGTHVTRIVVTATGTTTAGVVRLFESNDGGTTKRLLEELLVGAFTPSTTVPVFSARFKQATLSQPLIMGASTNNILYVSTHNAETFNVFAEGYDLT